MAVFTGFLIIILGILLKKHSDYERKTLKIETYSIRSHKIKKKKRILFLSDLHETEFGDKNEELLDKIRRCRPDMVLIGGDLVVSRKPRRGKKYAFDDVEISINFLKELKREFPVYLALGNHESRMMEKAKIDTSTTESEDDNPSKKSLRLWEDALNDIRVLDRSFIDPDDPSDIRITGVTLPLSYYRKLFFKKKPKLSPHDSKLFSGTDSSNDEDAKTSRFQIVLLHSPLYYKEAIDQGADLVLSGHFHGGTIRLPYFGALMTPQFQFLVKECAGAFSYKDGKMLVSRGLGTHSVNVRINDYPEITVIDLLPKK